MTISTECLNTLSLSAIKGLGLKTFYYLYRELGSVSAILSAGYPALSALGVKPAICQAICDVAASPDVFLQQAENLLIHDWICHDGRQIVCLEDASYPALLKEIYCPPPILYLEGCSSVLSVPAIAMVGSRNPSIAGRQNAFAFAQDLSLAGFCINSGLALGIDAASHRGVLRAEGVTCAVLGTGLDIIYPKQHCKLADEIRERGVLVSEMPLGTKPLPANFPRRNRIISGLSRGVLVVEASVKSGSLITANYALEQNREVFAMPGSIDNPMSRGCHALIKQGAKLVEQLEDVLDEWQRGQPSVISESNTAEPAVFGQLSAEEQSVLASLHYDCVSFDLLVEHTDIGISALTRALMSLELKGLLCSVPGGYQRIKQVKSPV